MIGFNKPFFSGNELSYIKQVFDRQKLSGNGFFTNECHQFFEQTYGFKKCLLTCSCTDALEMSALLLNIEPGDEVILPSFTFVSTANAFMLRGANVIFADSRPDHPGMDESSLEQLVTRRTKAIVVVHYAGVATDMDLVMEVARRHNLFVVEDAAQAIDSYYINSLGEKRPLGGIGHLSTFSFHETKNIICGEGGMLVINDPQFEERAEILWEKGTNRSAFFRGEVDKYGWVDLGSSFLPSEVIAAILRSQLERVEDIQRKRLAIWQQYNGRFSQVDLAGINLPMIPEYATNNAHMYYLVLPSLDHRSSMIKALKESGIQAVFHYQSLHKSDFYNENYCGAPLAQSDRYSECLVRLPLYYELESWEIDLVADQVIRINKELSS